MVKTFNSCFVVLVVAELKRKIEAVDALTKRLDTQQAELDLRFQILETASYDGVLLWKVSGIQRYTSTYINFAFIFLMNYYYFPSLKTLSFTYVNLKKHSFVPSLLLLLLFFMETLLHVYT